MSAEALPHDRRPCSSSKTKPTMFETLTTSVPGDCWKLTSRSGPSPSSTRKRALYWYLRRCLCR